jgi:NDP-sugar pyrophosphorylase family protein
MVVLAGGLATRLRPVTEKIPKSLVPINGEPFAYHQLRLFYGKGLRRIHFCLGHLGEMVEAAIRDSEYASKMQISFSYDGLAPLGTGGAIKKSLPFLSEDFYIIYGDSYLDISFKGLEDFYISRKNETAGVMAVFKNSGQFDKSNVIFEDENLFYSKKTTSERMTYIDYGVSILNKTAFQTYPHDTAFDLSEIFEDLSSKGQLTGYEVFNRFFEVGSFQGIKELTDHLKKSNLL